MIFRGRDRENRIENVYEKIERQNVYKWATRENKHIKKENLCTKTSEKVNVDKPDKRAGGRE
jgi:trehalose-6-phosphate synthase